MGLTERTGQITEILTLELVDCPPVAPARVSVGLPLPPSETPTGTVRDATLGQTGADPPPED